MRYLRLYAHLVRFSFSKALEFRLDFTFRIVMDIFYYVVNILFFKVIYLHSPMLGGWTEDQMMVFVSIFLTIDALNMTVFSSNMWWLPTFINKGDLDYYLIRPVSSLFLLSVREFSANSFINLIITFGILTVALLNYQGAVPILSLFFLILLIINGMLVYYCIQLLLILPVFWTQSSRGFIDLFYTLSQVAERPDRIYKGWSRVIFTTVVPFTMIASFPARLFLEDFDWKIFLHLVGSSLFIWVMVLVFWKKGLKSYSSASS